MSTSRQSRKHAESHAILVGGDDLLKRIPKTDPRLTWPIFTISEAARNLGIAPSTLGYWARPWGKGQQLVTVFPADGRAPTMPFIGFAEAFVIKAALDAGVPSSRVRPNILALKKHFGQVDHALAHHCVFTDGAEILYRNMEDDPDGDLSVARTNQKQFRETVRNQLQLISYGDDGFAERLHLPKFEGSVVVDPLVASGAPIIENAGVRVEDLVNRHKAGDDLEEIAFDFEVSVKEVREIVGAA